MKNIIAIFTITIALISFSCDDFLTDAAVPIDKPGGDDFYNTPLKVKGGIIGIYQNLYELYEIDPQGQNFFSVYENRSDNGAENQAQDDERNNFETRVDDDPNRLWNTNFEIVSSSNIMIESIERGFPDWASDPEMSRFMAEARFMRAFAYFHLTTIFGGVPIITEQIRTLEGAQAVSRSSEDAVFDQLIIPDLEFAADNCITRSELESLGDLGHAPKAAAQIILAEAYLVQGRYAEAEVLAEAIINSGEYMLVPNFEDLYGEGADNNPESIFEIQYDFDATGVETAYSRLLPFELRDAANFTFTMTVSVPTEELLNTMIGDTRYTVTLDSGLYNMSDPDNIVFDRARFWKKYQDFSLTSAVVDDWNIKLYRLADAYHFAAEAEIQQGKVDEAFAHLNVLRQRAGMPDYDPIGVSQEMALSMYLHERRMEFAGEMKRWRDLKRTGMAIEVIENYLGNPIDPNQLLYPIPIEEINANPVGITQNPGY